MQQKGFTLIELLVAISILLLLMGLGIANYISFNDRQQLIQSAEQVREAIADAQNSARSGKLRGCNRLVAYRVDILASGTVEIVPLCEGEDGDITKDPSQTFELSDSLEEVVGPGSLFTSPVKGLIFDSFDMDDGDPAGIDPFTITLENNYGTIEVEVQHTGSINIGSVEKQ